MILEIHDADRGNSLVGRHQAIDYDYQVEEFVLDSASKELAIGQAPIVRWILIDHLGVRCVWERTVKLARQQLLPTISFRSRRYQGTYHIGESAPAMPICRVVDLIFVPGRQHVVTEEKLRHLPVRLVCWTCDGSLSPIEIGKEVIDFDYHQAFLAKHPGQLIEHSPQIVEPAEHPMRRGDKVILSDFGRRRALRGLEEQVTYTVDTISILPNAPMHTPGCADEWCQGECQPVPVHQDLPCISLKGYEHPCLPVSMFEKIEQGASVEIPSN